MSLLHNSPPAGFEPPEPPPGFGTPEQIYARALDLGYGPSRRTRSYQRVALFAYWTTVILAVGWVFAMALDREPPVRMGPRTVINPEGQVHAGERLLISSTRRRSRICELTRRWVVVDGAGRRLDYEPEKFDAYGEVTPPGAEPQPEINGPIIPPDAMPGHARNYSILAWDCNMLQRALGWSIVLFTRPVEFEIIARRERP